MRVFHPTCQFICLYRLLHNMKAVVQLTWYNLPPTHSFCASPHTHTFKMVLLPEKEGIKSQNYPISHNPTIDIFLSKTDQSGGLRTFSLNNGIN